MTEQDSNINKQADMLGAMSEIYGMYCSALRAGFTETQALRFVATYLAELGKTGEPSD